MAEMIYEVYAKVDERKVVLSIDGGVTMSNVDTDTWVKIDEGTEPQRFGGCQQHYVEMPLYTDDFIPRYKLVGTEVVLRDASEIEADKISKEENREPTFEEKLDAWMRYQGLLVKRMSNGVFEVVKEELTNGDFANPIQIPVNGITIETGKWYYADDPELPHEAIRDAFVTPEDFYDSTWFDFVE